jgi:hypothetical protein
VGTPDGIESEVTRDGRRAALVAVLLCSALTGCGKNSDPAAIPVMPPKNNSEVALASASVAAPASVAVQESNAPTDGLPHLSHVKALVRGNSARITFDPFPGAVDYRVYAAPAAADVHRNPDGSLGWIDHATYRCGGLRSVAPLRADGDEGPPSNPYPNWVAVLSQVEEPVEWFKRGIKDATLGYGFREPTADTVPIYAVGDPSPTADNYGNGMRETETRSKLYVRENGSYLAKGWRDDGIAFYAPASAASKACQGKAPVPILTQIYQEKSAPDPVYYGPGLEAVARARMKQGPGAPAFLLCPNHVDGSEPVMRVHYMLLSPGGWFGGQGAHDELALGRERFDRARCQGAATGPCATVSRALWEVHWSNITKPTQLVVEALDAGCPFQGLLGANPLPATLNPQDRGAPATEVVSTFDQLRAAAAHGEVFLNGQFDASSTPHPIARSLVQVAPAPRPPMDFESHFATAPETLTETLVAGSNAADCGYTQQIRDLTHSGDPQCDGSHHLQSATYDALAFDQFASVYSLGVTQGELWSDFSSGELRFSPRKVTATMSDAAYLHVAMEASSFTTDRRYPQIVISQQDFMTGEWLLKRSSITPNPAVQPFVLVQPFDAGPSKMVIELELCNQRGWAVNDHCPWFLLEKGDPPAKGQLGPNNPHAEAHDHLQHDDSARFDVYLSTKRAYVFFEDEPYGCADIANHTLTDPSGGAISPPPAPPPTGPVTVAFGDVHYHPTAEGGELGLVGPFGISHMFMNTIRHYDYVGFKSGVPAPPWDETRFPCIRQMHQGGNAGPQHPESD